MLPSVAIKKTLSVNDRPYPVIDAGEGPLVVCLHGFPDNHESFQHLVGHDWGALVAYMVAHERPKQSVRTSITFR